jgi:phospholipid transport system substrate-binding protein
VVKPLRQASSDSEVVVRSEIRGGAEPIPIDYRLEKTPDADSGWRIYNFNILGIWLVDNYRTQFSQEINAKGIDGLIATLSERNKTNNRK